MYGPFLYTIFICPRQICERLGLSYKNSAELNKIIDNQLPEHRPPFKRATVRLEGEVYDVFFRDVIKCVKALFGDAEFAQYLVFTPERHYTDATRTVRLYHEIHTGKWWWATQVRTQFFSDQFTTHCKL